jgi:hypothetical protein
MSTPLGDAARPIRNAPPVNLRELDQGGIPGVNGFAVAGLIMGILGGLLGPIFCIVALNQISGTRQTGRGMAIAGLVFSGLWLAVIILVIVGALMSA